MEWLTSGEVGGACLMMGATMYGISDAVSSTLPNHVDDTLKQCYPKSYVRFSPVQPYINHSKGGGRPLRRMGHALNKAPELASFRAPHPEDPSLAYSHNHGGIRTAIQFALRRARWITGQI
jgi:hypothetical protein